MMFNKNLKNVLLVIFATLILSACSTAKKTGDIDGDVYTGTETDASDPSWSSLLSK